MIQKLRAKWESLPAALRQWLVGLFVAMEGGAVGAFGQFLLGGQPLCFTMACFRTYGAAVLSGVFIAVRMYLKQSPLKQMLQQVWDGNTERRTRPDGIQSQAAGK